MRSEYSDQSSIDILVSPILNVLNDLVNSSTDTFFWSYESDEHEKTVNIEYQKLQIHRKGTLFNN